MVPPVAVAYSGGGPFATACGMGVADALREQGFPLAGTPTLGTSGGAWAAAAAMAGISHERVVATTRHVTLPTLKPQRLYTAAREVFGDAMQPLLYTSIVRVRDGRRVRLSGADHAVADIVAASSSVPGMTIPHRVDGRLYVDGGARSWISADLAPPAERLLVIAPALSPSFGTFGVLPGRHLGYELARWKRRHGGRVTVIRVEEDIGSRITRWKHLFDPGLAQEAYVRARERAAHDLAPRGRIHEFLRS